MCADEERPGFSYNEDCDTITVPFKQRECYCKYNLCNAGSKIAGSGSTPGAFVLTVVSAVAMKVLIKA